MPFVTAFVDLLVSLRVVVFPLEEDADPDAAVDLLYDPDVDVPPLRVA